MEVQKNSSPTQVSSLGILTEFLEKHEHLEPRIDELKDLLFLKYRTREANGEPSLCSTG